MSRDDKKCGAFLPGADPARCVWCGVKAEEHDLSVVPSSTEISEPVAYAVVDSSGDPREANSIHWPATCRHFHEGDPKAAAQAWADRFGYSIVPLYASPLSARSETVWRDALARIKTALKEALEERLQQQHEYEKDARKWESQGDMYGWNFHMGMAAGGNGLMHCFYRVDRAIEAAEKEIASVDGTTKEKA